MRDAFAGRRVRRHGVAAGPGYTPGLVQGGTRHAEGARAAQRTEVGAMDTRVSAVRDEVAS
jgi:hypothetical protein